MEQIEPKLGDPIPEEWLSKAENEMKAKFRSITLDEFKGNKNVELHIYHPTPGDDSIAGTIYSKAHNRLIKDPDLLTNSQMKKLLEERNLWGKEQEDALQAIRDQMRDIELSVAHMRVKPPYNKATMLRLRTKWFELRDKLQELNLQRESYYSNTVEGLAEEEKIKSKLSLCVKYPDGKKVWNSITELDQEEDKTNLMTLMQEAVLFWMGLSQEIIRDLPAKILFGGEDDTQVS